MEVGEVRIAEDRDYSELKRMCTCHDGWKQEYQKNGITVWTKMTEVSEFKMVKVHSTLKDVSANTLYDVLHDPGYRKSWDSSMVESYDICCLNPNNDIGYYSFKPPKPLKARDFVTLRSWLDMMNEKIIINHSVNHESVPVKKNCVRGISYMTGYYIQASGNPEQPGCVLSYVTQCDPKGKLPVWCVNKVAQYVAPKVMNKIHKAAKGYPKWKAKHNPQWKPWLYPEQMTLPRLQLNQILSIEDQKNAKVIDETNAQEAEEKEEVDGEDSSSLGSTADAE
ncbi:hypothetical protein CAPTEDRAFT_102229 [Capitella teleta]|uniref:START domain-containing protein 10 n=1 Tax=Capitella teleta TaxID=283909 RepID=R7VAQ5_CAPTE|nr:hypothetical protein CAPTEDRAFT_102229 [Capitella teleta]|eukprot:ELU12780.1 hypothetical protein CAPTEDRAFT_102229 [Capitella teleta]